MSIFVNSRRSSLRVRNACSLGDVIVNHQSDNAKSRWEKSKIADDSDSTLTQISNVDPRDINAKSKVLIGRKKKRKELLRVVLTI